MANKHWQNFGELAQSKTFEENGKNEFPEELPFYSDHVGILESKSPRRDFLKYLGFSTAAAAIAASCEIPIKKSIPFANKPEDIVPGTANFYATTYVQDGDAVSILAKVRDGRPIKIEGNLLSPITAGGTSARVQASVLDLYDTARLRYPFISRKTNEVTFEAIDKAITSDLASLSGGQVVLLTSTINSPTGLEVINQFLAKYPGSRHIQYDADSHSGMLLANESSYGKRAIPSYRFNSAKVIVSLGADFLGTWLSPIEFSRQYAQGRKINEKNPTMNKHFHFESVLSMTGSNADERYMHLPTQTGAVAVALLNAINGSGATGISDAKLKA
ncbi:MAG: TAT-variant-translocated molybdopterin oxidoreductase, partial [Bacteroidota bacterium]|nr:TAT-variant-translocated molybdopterin oxidoreductase [Bacteroidota bacterium]